MDELEIVCSRKGTSLGPWSRCSRRLRNRFSNVGRLAFACWAVSLPGLLGDEIRSRILKDTTSFGIVERVEIADESALRDQAFRGFAETFLDAHRGRFKLLMFVAGTDPFEVAVAMWHGSSDVRIADLLVQSLRDHGPLNHPIARLLADSGGAVADMCHGSECTHLVLRGTDPSLVHYGDQAYSLLHFHLSAVPAKATNSHEGRGLLTLYFKTAAPLSRAAAVWLIRRYQRTTEIREVEVNIRHDEWFIDDGRFPGVYRFNGPLPFPNPVDLRKLPEISCFQDTNGIRCSE
jgi:hypothetical protein